MKSVLLNTTVIGSRVGLPRHPRLILGDPGKYIYGDILDANAVTTEINKAITHGDSIASDIQARMEDIAQTLDTKIEDKIAAVIDSAPEALDTLREIAQSLHNDADLAGTLISQITALDSKVELYNIDQTTALRTVDDILSAKVADLEDILTWKNEE